MKNIDYKLVIISLILIKILVLFFEKLDLNFFKFLYSNNIPYYLIIISFFLLNLYLLFIFIALKINTLEKQTIILIVANFCLFIILFIDIMHPMTLIMLNILFYSIMYSIRSILLFKYPKFKYQEEIDALLLFFFSLFFLLSIIIFKFIL